MKKGQKMTIEQRQRLSDSHKGQKAWNKGIKNWMPEESKAAMIEKKKGKVAWNKGLPSPWTSERNKINNPQKKGELSTTWKGGRWVYQKRKALERDNYTCQKCGMRDDEIMQVDHIKQQSKFPELKYDIQNLQTLCPNCHARKTISEKKVTKNTDFFYITHT